MQTLIIGRDTANQIVINDSLVSRTHAQLIVLDNGQVLIKDLGSSNGTFVNGNKITEYYLNPGDIVKCGSFFLNWSQYVNSAQPAAQQVNYQQPYFFNEGTAGQGLIPITNEYNVADVFKYLTTRILEIGELFKTNWNRLTAIVLLNGLPVVFTFILSLLLYIKYLDLWVFFYLILSAALSFTVCPFITMLLFSLSKKVQLDKIALVAGLLGFIEFVCQSIYAFYRWIYFYHSSHGNYLFNQSFNYNNLDLFLIITGLVFVILLVNLVIAFYLLIYKYFIAIGISKSKSVYLTVCASGVNVILLVLFTYFISLII